MKYQFIATGLAVAATTFGPSAHAQSQGSSNVSISGLVDAAVTKKTGSTANLQSLGRNHLAIAGTEDLGGGLAATFRLSTRFEIDTGTQERAPVGTRPFFQDESTVGLKGGFGSIRLGRAVQPLNGSGWRFDPWYAFDKIASPVYNFFAPDFLPDPGNAANPTGSDLDYTRLAKAVFYDSPSIGGFVFRVNSAVTKKPVDQRRGFATAVNYSNGPFAAMVDFEENSQRDKLLYLGTSYQWGDFGLMGTASRVLLNRSGSIYGPAWTNWVAARNPTSKRTSMTLGATYAVGQGTFLAGFGRDFQGSTNFFNYIGSTFNRAGTGYSGASNFYSVGYRYQLSKRTFLIADLTRVDWKFTDDQGHKSANGVALGVSHAF